ncbi:UNVERIFIED_CONTAM: uncharacterized protein DUF5050 [Acetivibrio alkalicellulosi]
MNCNLENGGLVLKVDDKIYISDIKNFSGTYVIDNTDEIHLISEGVFWFMNFFDSHIFCSEQKKDNSLMKFDVNYSSEEIILNVPCYGLYGSDKYYYYINEVDRKLYRCFINDRKEELIVDDQVICFCVSNRVLYYSTSKGIQSYNLDSEDKEHISDSHGINMMILSKSMLFTDVSNDYLLTTIDLETGRIDAIEDIYPGSINTDGKYLYCTNRKNSSSIYRIDIDRKNSIRICGDSGEYLHIIDDEIYFCNKLEWYKMSKLGGQPNKVFNQD